MIDLLLLLMAVIWGTNYSIVKHAFREIDPQAFNALRMSIASLIFLAVILGVRARASAAARDNRGQRVLHARDDHRARLVGARRARRSSATAAISTCFMGGLARTSVANSSLMLGATPVVVALLSAMLGTGADRPAALGRRGAVDGRHLPRRRHGLSLGSHGATGDLMMFAAVCCWAIYTIGARPLMTRHSPVGVTGMSMMIGTLMYLPLAWPSLRALRLERGQRPRRGLR